MKTKFVLIIFTTLLFFSANSLLARGALLHNDIDAYSFTFLRLLSGATVLVILLYTKERKISLHVNKNWLSSFMLFLYAISFSYAYINLNAGVGALILFAVVQLTLIVLAFFHKEKISIQKLIGLAIAFAGLVYLLYPRENFDLSFVHTLLMILSGFAWGIYTILGKNSTNATLHTADNFLKSILYLVIFFFLFVSSIHADTKGIVLALFSGGITSALGYVLWYYILPKISVMTSGALQLLVPPIAIFLSVFLLGESLSATLVISTVVILGGIFITIKK